MEIANFSRDLPSCTSMGVNCTGQLALISGRRCQGLLNLDNPSVLLNRETRTSKWDVISCQWSPLEENKIAVASNNKIEILNLYDTDLLPEFSLRAHTRVITDIAWHTHNKDILATSATDAFIYLWDLRDGRRPKMALQAVAGAVKVKWNKVSGKYLASAHEGEIKLWDIRASKSPVQYINAHLSRIYDMDWSHEDENHLVSASQDMTVKYWNISNPGKAEGIIKVQSAPVWRVNRTPFGHGLLTLGMQSVVRGENNLMLWNNNNLVSPVHTFYVPDMILDLAWRQWSESNRCQLVTWSKDLTLRIWNLDLELQEKCGLVLEEEVEIDRSEDFEQICPGDDRLSLDDEGSSENYVEFEEEETVVVASPINSFRRPIGFNRKNFSASLQNSLPGNFERDKPMNLNYEFSLINLSEKLRVEHENSEERVFTVSAQTRKNQLVLNVKFPINYPNQVAPSFSFLEGTTIDNVSRNNILQRLKSAAKQQTSRNRRCLESCLRQFELSVDNLNLVEEEQLQVNNPQLSGITKSKTMFGEFPDHNVPFPRSSGARFCGDGHLVCFGFTRQYMVKIQSPELDPAEVELGSSADIAKTPRALSAYSSKMSLLSNGSTSPKFGGMNVLSLFDQNGSQDFPLQARVSRVRFSSQKSRTLSSSSDDNLWNTADKRNKLSVLSRSKKLAEAKVTVYNCSALLPYCKKLASKYLVPCSPGALNLSTFQICEHNAQVAIEHDRPDLQKIWSLAAVVASSNSSSHDQLRPWAAHPCGRSLLTSMISHHVSIKDVQTAAVLSCIFGNKVEYTPRIRKKNSKSESIQVDKDSACDALSYTSPGRANRSNSDTQNDETYHGSMERRLSMYSDDGEEYSQFWEDSRLLDPKLNSTYDGLIESYADLLYRWKMFQQRAELMKQISELKHVSSYTSSITLICPTCGKILRGPWCISCRTLSFNCSVCRSPCRGLVSLCQQCGHGGHALHLSHWFAQNISCPSGCGCKCPKK